MGKSGERFPGVWRCRYWYPNTKHHNREDVREHVVRIEASHSGFVLHSVPNEEDSYMLARFTVDTNIATGVWQEHTSPYGEWEGMSYKGAFQLIIDEDYKHMAGQWVALGGSSPNPQIYNGRWEVSYIGDRSPIRAHPSLTPANA